MSRNFRPQLGSLSRRTVSLLTGLTFLVVSVTGIIVFVQPFSLGVVALHALMGFVFIGLIALHIVNNSRPLTGYLRSKAFWATLAVTTLLTLLFWWRPAPVRQVIGWSGNLGPAMERFDMDESGMIFDYAPSPDYKMQLTIKTGPSYRVTDPPQIAIWLENQGGYHIKTLLSPGLADQTPYWSFKHAGWEKAKREAPEHGEIDAVSSPTPNGSFDPAAYILPDAADDPGPYRLLFEINQPGDDQPSLVHAVDIDNSLPRTFQLLELRGYPKRETSGAGKKESWDLYYVDDSIGSSLELIDSALLTIQRKPGQDAEQIKKAAESGD